MTDTAGPRSKRSKTGCSERHGCLVCLLVLEGVGPRGLGRLDVVRRVADDERLLGRDADALDRKPDELRAVRRLAAVAARGVVEERAEPDAAQALLGDPLGEPADEPEAEPAGGESSSSSSEPGRACQCDVSPRRLR